MNILYCSNWSAQSSYALQARLIVPRLQAMGHTVTVFELSAGHRLPYSVNGATVLSTIFDPLGNDCIVEYALHSKADAVITLMDVWRFDPNTWGAVPFYPHCPIDHSPVTPAVRNVLAAAKRVIAMSEFGVKELKRVGIEPLYAPLAYDKSIWYPRDKQAARAKLGIPDDAFWVSFVGVNDSIPSRKGIPELLSAWQTFSQQHSDATLYLHTGMHGNLAINGIGGVKIDVLMGTLGLDVERIKVVDQYEYRTGIKSDNLAMMIAASDALILPSRSEGFGLPLIEAQAVGTPVITTRTAAGQELVKAGWLIDGESEWSYQDSFWLRPGILSIVECLEAAYQQRDNPVLRQLAIEGVREYEIENVMATYWKPLLTTLAETSLDTLQVKVS